MATKNFKKNPSGSHEPKVVGEIINEILRGDSHFAAAYRRHRAAKAAEAEAETGQLFRDFFPHTEPCVDVKFFTQKAGPMDVGDFIPGVITRDSEFHFSFVQNATKERPATRRTPCIFRGAYINLHQSDDGSMHVTFRRPRLTKNFTFGDFCRAAAEELFIVSGLVEE